MDDPESCPDLCVELQPMVCSMTWSQYQLDQPLIVKSYIPHQQKFKSRASMSRQKNPASYSKFHVHKLPRLSLPQPIILLAIRVSLDFPAKRPADGFGEG